MWYYIGTMSIFLTLLNYIVFFIEYDSYCEVYFWCLKYISEYLYERGHNENEYELELYYFQG